MIYLLLASLFILSAYLADVCTKGGAPYSISSTYYRLEHPMLFFLVMADVSFTLLPVAMEVGREASQWAIFLAAIGMLLVGGASNFRDSNDKKVHNAGAIMALLFSQVWVAFNCPWCLFVWLAYVIYTAVMMFKKVSDSVVSDFLRTKPMFWIEIAALAATYLTVLIRM